MTENQLGVVEDTLYVPMLGRIYASKHFKEILYDEKALELEPKLPENVIQRDTQTQYTYLASASRSANMDRFIQDFLKRKPDGIPVQLGCGLETTYGRNDNGHTQWYEVDLPHVIDYRRSILPEGERETYLAGNAFETEWIEQIRSKHPTAPLLVTASGFFYYFEEATVLDLMRMIGNYGDIELVFDTVNKSGMTMMRKKYMKTVGHADAKMFFYVDSASELVEKIGGNAKLLAEEKYYSHISRKGLDLVTRISMQVSDWFSMVKMIHLGFSENHHA